MVEINNNVLEYLEKLSEIIQYNKFPEKLPEQRLLKKDVRILHNTFEKYISNSLRGNLDIQELAGIQSKFIKLVEYGLNYQKKERESNMTPYQRIVSSMLNGASLPDLLPSMEMNQEDRTLINHSVMHFVDELLSPKLTDYEKAIKKMKIQQLQKLFKHGHKMEKINNSGLILVCQEDKKAERQFSLIKN
jgi:hypothetical protein